ncbi:DUF6268 family outer membrane beta-barrel protein [Lutibacter citreus]|uniref:DUF6268 family outer membrane beta-barrel protein n=1 Tax=Lutibacter citreus TaxID=2138210 RepID=UPI000DBE3D39|nr:DUF6268 family outer membrane beta-barrel protein [Lutibacter citreus]
MAFRVLFILVLCIGSNVIYGQQDNLFATEFNYVPSNSNSVGFKNSNVTFNYAVKVKKGTLINSLEYSNYKVDYNSNEKLNSDLLGIECFNSIGYSLKFNKEILNGWSYSIGVSPTITSNLESSISLDDFIINGEAVFSKKYTKSKLNLGVIRNSSFGFITPIPLITFEGEINENLKYSVGFPITEFSYKVNNTNMFSMYVKPKGFYANIGNEAYVNVDGEVKKAKFQSFISGLKFSHCIDNNWKIEVDAGYQLKSDYELLDENLNSVYEFKTKNNISVGVSLKFNLLNDKS